jgi:hypothetical protein
MDKKTYILKILNTLKWEWPIANWLIVLVKNSDLNDSVLTSLSDMLNIAIKQSTTKIERDKLIAWKWIINDLKQSEIEEMKNNKIDLLGLEKRIENI